MKTKENTERDHFTELTQSLHAIRNNPARLFLLSATDRKAIERMSNWADKKLAANREMARLELLQLQGALRQEVETLRLSPVTGRRKGVVDVDFNMLSAKGQR